MPRGLKIFSAFIVALIAGWAIPILYYIAATNFFGLTDRDGGGAMGAIFILGPIAGILGGVAAALFVASRTRRAPEGGPV